VAQHGAGYDSTTGTVRSAHRSATRSTRDDMLVWFAKLMGDTSA
jgi:hypothetical protein